MSRTKAILITFFLSGFGVHRFMAGKTGTGILWLLTGGCFGIGAIVDFVMVCTGNFKDKNGQERLLSQEEIDELIKQEEVAIDSGQSQLTNPNGGGLGLGGAILASAAGAILGSYIGNKLFNNPNYQANSQRNYKSPQAYERSKNSFNSAKTGASGASKTSSGKSGFFGGGNSSQSTSTNRNTGSMGS